MAILSFAILNNHILTQSRRIVRPCANYSYQRLGRDLYALEKRYPTMLRVGEIGASRQGLKLYAAVAGAPGAKYHVLIHGSIHAREHMTSLLTMMQLEELLRKGVPKNINFHFIPMVNPDGVTISQTCAGDDLTKSIYQDDQKAGYTALEPCDYLRDYKANAAGVDLNRNFDADWYRVDTRPMPSSANYRGPLPQSEPETKALVSYTKRFPFAATLSYHATGSEIYYEFGNNSPVNEESFKLAQAVNRCTRYALLPDDGVSSGGYKDWAIQKQNIPSLTIEVGRGDTPLSLNEYPDIFKRNRSVPFAVAQWLGAQP